MKLLLVFVVLSCLVSVIGPITVDANRRTGTLQGSRYFLENAVSYSGQSRVSIRKFTVVGNLLAEGWLKCYIQNTKSKFRPLCAWPKS